MNDFTQEYSSTLHWPKMVPWKDKNCIPVPFPQRGAQSFVKVLSCSGSFFAHRQVNLSPKCAPEAAVSKQYAALDRPCPGTHPTAQDASRLRTPRHRWGERPALLTGGAAVVSLAGVDWFACPHSPVSGRAPPFPTSAAFLWGRLPPWQVCPPSTASPRASHQFVSPHHSFSSALARWQASRRGTHGGGFWEQTPCWFTLRR